DPEIGAGAYRAMIDRARLVEELGFDWISLSEHHYSPRILTPSPPLSAAWIAAQVKNIKIALLGPIVPQSNPIRIAEELGMLGISRESCELAARNRLGLGVSYGPFEVMAKSTRYYREQAAQYGWEPGPDDIIYRANMVLGETDAEAETILKERAGIAPFPVRA